MDDKHKTRAFPSEFCPFNFPLPPRLSHSCCRDKTAPGRPARRFRRFSILHKFPQIAEAGHFHAWTLTDDTVIATLHVSPTAGTAPLALPPLVASWLKDRYEIDHVTVQVDAPGRLQQAGDL